MPALPDFLSIASLCNKDLMNYNPTSSRVKLGGIAEYDL
jgi:hypothetical protein